MLWLKNGVFWGFGCYSTLIGNLMPEVKPMWPPEVAEVGEYIILLPLR